MATPVTEVFARFEMFDEHGAPFPLERLPGRLALRGPRDRAGDPLPRHENGQRALVGRARNTGLRRAGRDPVRRELVSRRHGPAARRARPRLHRGGRPAAERDAELRGDAQGARRARRPEARELGRLLPRRGRRRAPHVRRTRRRGEAQPGRGDRSTAPVRRCGPRQADPAGALRGTLVALRARDGRGAQGGGERRRALRGSERARLHDCDRGSARDEWSRDRCDDARPHRGRELWRRRPPCRRRARSPRSGRDRERPQLRARAGNGARQPGARVRRGRRLPGRRGRRDPPLEPGGSRAHGARGAGRRRPHDPGGTPGLAGCAGRRKAADVPGRGERPRALALGLARRLRRRDRVRVPRPDRRPNARAAEERLHLDGLARAPHAARRDLRRCDDRAARRVRGSTRRTRRAARRDLRRSGAARADDQRRALGRQARVRDTPRLDRELRPRRAAPRCRRGCQDVSAVEPRARAR